MDGEKFDTLTTAEETVKGWAVELRRGRYLRHTDAVTGRADGITSHPEEAELMSRDEAVGRAEDNIDEGNEDGFPRAVYIIVNTTVIIP